MRVKAIVLDGFKSYAHRQELSDLGPHFNAITGLNGSGKSNIFDAICFVMGISNLKKVRADDTRDLIFKNGNAGIQRATVSIEFENSDPCPPEYPRSVYPTITVQRQILTNGASKFLLNGRAVAINDVRKFFQNIGLNVDNPHFMVLQGTVHKLIGMKSQEILGWLEEAAGTRVFDARRRAAEHMIASKDRKLAELDRIIDHEIGPELARMSAEQDAYNNFVKQIEGLEQRRKFRTALAFYTAAKDVESTARRAQQVKEDAAAAQQRMSALPREVEEAAMSMRELEGRVNAPGEAIEQVYASEQEAKKSMSKTEGLMTGTEKSIKTQERAITRAAEELAKLQRRLDAFMGTSEARRREHEARLAALDAAERQVEDLKEAIRLTSSGVQATSGGLTLQQDLDRTSRAIISVEGQVTRRRAAIDALAEEARSLQSRVDRDKGARGAAQQSIATAQQRVAAAQRVHAPFADAERQLREAMGQQQALQQQYQRCLAEASRAGATPLHLENPTAVDLERHVLGRVGELFTVADQRFNVALGVGATRAALDRVVATDDVVIQAIVERGRPTTRTHFVALNKAVGGVQVTEERLGEARRVAQAQGGSVELALDLVRFDSRLAPVMQRTFGAFLVCSSVELARELAYNPRIRCKAVTMEGDVADPTGTMSGGAAFAAQDLIARYAAAAKAKEPLDAVARELRSVADSIHALQAKLRSGEAARAELDEAEAALQRATQHFDGASGGASALQLLQENTAARELQQQQLEEKECELEALKRRRSELEARQGADPAAVLKEMRQQLTRHEGELRKLQCDIDAGRAAFEQLETEKAGLEQRIGDLQSEVREKESEQLELRAAMEQLKGDLAASRARLAELEAERAAIDERSKELREALADARAAHQRLVAELDEAQRAVKDSEQAAKQLARAGEEAKKTLRDLDRQHSWLAAEQSQFGAPDGPYYFTDAERTAATLRELQEAEVASEQMGRRVNKKATVLYDQCKHEYNELVAKRSTLAEDRGLILSTISIVESRKWDSLDRMVAKVSEGFSNLFHACLPGASCRLVESRDAETRRLTGLEVRVAFNGKEKESLSELSGGQRSLLALCLILAILRIRKAPIYILDEVDAALDPSHTQNIGKMIQVHFPDAQFLLISLKDGMFNNANVLYEIRNTQGYSEISRKEAKK